MHIDTCVTLQSLSPAPAWAATSSTHVTTPKAKKPRKKLIPERLQAIYADVVAKAIELRRQGMTHAEVCEELNRLGFSTRTSKALRHPQQVIKLLRSFANQSLRSSG